MAEITVEESWRQIRTLIDRAEQDTADGRPDEAVERWRAVLAHPCAHHQVAAYEVLDEIHRAYREAGHYEDAWQELGEPADQQLVDRVERFCDEWTRPPFRRPWGDAPPLEDRACAHCGYQPGVSPTEQDERARRNRRRLLEAEAPEALARFDAGFGREPRAKLSGPVELAIGWFPADQWPDACERWPDLLGGLPPDHRAYSQATEARIKRIARHAPGNRLHVAAMTADGLQAHAEGSGYDPGSGEARSAYAATLLQAGDAVVWPPGRNESCWCGSEHKYKKCCGPVPAAMEESS